MPSAKFVLTFVAMLMLLGHGSWLVAGSSALSLVQRSHDSALLNCCLLLLKRCFAVL